MNQPFAADFSLTPDPDPAALALTLGRLLVPGDIMDSRLERYCSRLDQHYRVYASTCPVPAWDSGLIISAEMRRQVEVYLPLAIILPAFRYLIVRSCCHEPFLPAAEIFSASSWYDVLALLPAGGDGNPAVLLSGLAQDEVRRGSFLAYLLVPGRFGGSFGRYERQLALIRQWLAGRRGASVRIFDAACGSGEQCYELAEQLLESGMDLERSTVTGITVEPLELAAAAHGWFPHDQARGDSFRTRISQTTASGAGRTLRFLAGDVRRLDRFPGSYDVVICNGLLGGPIMHEMEELTQVIAGLACLVQKGGLLLAADRFHAGWRRAVPRKVLGGLLENAGLQLLDCEDGLAALRS